MVSSYSKPEPWNLGEPGLLVPGQMRLWPGLISLVPFWHGGQEWDYIRNQPLFPHATNQPTWSQSRRGLVSVTPAGAEYGFNWGLDSTWLPTTAITVLVHKRKTDTTNRASGHFGPYTSASAAERCGVNLPWSDGTVYWDFGGFTAGTSRLSAAGLTFGDDFWIFNAGPRGMEIWQNGYLRASQTGHATRSSSGAAMWIHLGNSETGQNSDAAECGLFAMWDRQLLFEDCRNLTLDPWQLIRYERRVRRSGLRAVSLSGTQPAPAGGTSRYAEVVMADAPTGYWKLNELAGTQCTDYSGNGLHMTYRNSPALGATSLLPFTRDYSVEFNGVDDYADRNPHALLQGGAAMTIECIARPFSFVSQVSPVGLYGGATDKGFWINITPTRGVRIFVSRDGSEEIYAGASNNLFPSANLANYHIVGTYDGSNIRCYVNGVLIDTEPLAGTIHPVTTAGGVAIGRLGTFGDYFGGSVDEVAIYQRVLSPAEITEHFDAFVAGHFYLRKAQTGTQPAPSGKLVSNYVTAFGLSGQSGTGDRTFGISLTGLVDTLWNNCLVVTVQTRGGFVVGSPTFNGDAMTAAQEVYSSGVYTGIWYLLNPDQVAGNVVVNINDDLGGCHIGVAVLSGVSQTNPVRAVNGQSPVSSVTSMSTNVTSKKGDVVIDSLVGPDNNTGTDPTIGANQNLIYGPDSTPGDTRGVSSREPGAAGTTTMSWTTLRSELWKHAVTTFRPAEPFKVFLTGTQPAPTATVVGQPEIVVVGLAGTQPAATGATTGKTVQKTLSGTAPAPTGAVVARQTLRRAFTGSQPAPTGALAKTYFTPLSGILPAPTGTLLVNQISRPVATVTPGNWTNEGGAASFHAALSDDTGSTYAQLVDGDDPSTLIVPMRAVDVPTVAGTGKVVVQARRA